MFSNMHWNRRGFEKNWARGDWSTINNLDRYWVSEFDKRKGMLECKRVIHITSRGTRIQESSRRDWGWVGVTKCDRHRESRRVQGS